jgi:hypothetical protein
MAQAHVEGEEAVVHRAEGDDQEVYALAGEVVAIRPREVSEFLWLE